MEIKKIIYVKRNKFNRWLSRLFFKNRVGSPMQIMLKTLKANKMLPRRLVALELFGFIGTNITADYQHLADYIEMWEIDPFYAKEAAKNITKAKVVCGDSIKAIKEGALLRRDYNFIVIDPNQYIPGYDCFESFEIFAPSLNYIADEAVVFVNIFNNINNFQKKYKTDSEQMEKWKNARRNFYHIDNVVDARGIDYLKAFENIINEKNITIVHREFISRNDYVGFGVFILKK